MASAFSRDAQLPIEPGLPRPDESSSLQTWSEQFTGRMYWWVKAIVYSINFLVQGYQRTIAALPTATVKYQGQLQIVNGTSTVPDAMYLGMWDGTAFAWEQVVTAITSAGSWTPGTVGNTAAVFQTFAVADVQVGWHARAALSPAAPAGVFVVADVTSAGHVTVTVMNFSGSSQTLGTSTVNISVTQA